MPQFLSSPKPHRTRDKGLIKWELFQIIMIAIWIITTAVLQCKPLLQLSKSRLVLIFFPNQFKFFCTYFCKFAGLEHLNHRQKTPLPIECCFWGNEQHLKTAHLICLSHIVRPWTFVLAENWTQILTHYPRNCKLQQKTTTSTPNRVAHRKWQWLVCRTTSPAQTQPLEIESITSHMNNKSTKPVHLYPHCFSGSQTFSSR